MPLTYSPTCLLFLLGCTFTCPVVVVVAAIIGGAAEVGGVGVFIFRRLVRPCYLPALCAPQCCLLPHDLLYHLFTVGISARIRFVLVIGAHRSVRVDCSFHRGVLQRVGRMELESQHLEVAVPLDEDFGVVAPHRTQVVALDCLLGDAVLLQHLRLELRPVVVQVFLEGCHAQLILLPLGLATN